jgi:hypothetical protein
MIEKKRYDEKKKERRKKKYNKAPRFSSYV